MGKLYLLPTVKSGRCPPSERATDGTMRFIVDLSRHCCSAYIDSTAVCGLGDRDATPRSAVPRHVVNPERSDATIQHRPSPCRRRHQHNSLSDHHRPTRPRCRRCRRRTSHVVKLSFASAGSSSSSSSSSRVSRKHLLTRTTHLHCVRSLHGFQLADNTACRSELQ